MQNNDLISRMGVLLSLPLFEKDQNGYPLNGGIQYARAMIEAAPSMDAEFVRHGRWITQKRQVTKMSQGDKQYTVIKNRCSECYHESDTFWNYCPNCGAKMDGKE